MVKRRYLWIQESGGKTSTMKSVLWALGAVSVMGLMAACGREEGSKAAAEPTQEASLPSAKAARFVKLEQVSEWEGRDWASVAELNVLDATGAALDRKGWAATADSAAKNDPAEKAIDGDPNSFWHTQWEGTPPPPPHTLTIDMGGTFQVSAFRYLARQDKSANGTIAKYRFYLSTDGVNWGDPVAQGDFSGMSAPSVEKTVVFATQTANRPPTITPPAAQKTPMGAAVSIPTVATDPDGDKVHFSAANLPPGISIYPETGEIFGTPITPGVYSVTVSAGDRKSADATVRFDWTVEPSAEQGVAAEAAGVRFVKLEELSEVNGKAWGSIAEFNLIGSDNSNLPRERWIASASSSDKNDRPSNAIDGSPDSFWHSQWDGLEAMPPHSFIIDLGQSTMIRGFRYLPRQDAASNGMIAKFRFYTSRNGIDWGSPVAEGDFTKQGAAKAEKTVMFK